MDPVVLSRIQFAWVIAWHFLLPAFTVGLASFIAVLEGLNLFTGREIYLRISTFLDQDFRRVVRHGRRFGHRHAVPDRHELEPLLRRHRRRRRAAARLRGADRFLPGGGFPRRAVVRTQAGAALGAFRRGVDGRPRARSFRPSGSSPPTAGCRRPPVTKSSTAVSCRRTGCRSSSARPSLIGSLTSSTRSTSPPASWSSAWPPPICGKDVSSRKRARCCR